MLSNPHKTNFCVFGTSQMLRRTPVPSIIFLGKDLAPVDASIDLGVVIDKHLSFNDHTSALVSDLFGKLCAISRIHHLLELPSLMCTVNVIIFRKLLYCSSVWAECYLVKGNLRRRREGRNKGSQVFMSGN